MQFNGPDKNKTKKLKLMLKKYNLTVPTKRKLEKEITTKI